MRLRIVLAVLSLLAFLSVSVAGYIYHASLAQSALTEAEKDISLQAERIQGALSAFLAENRKTVKALAGLKEMRRALQAPRGGSLAGANAVLDHFRDAVKADVCYLMDRNGDTIASSNRNAPDSFVGCNFAFRPYWRQAIGGSPATYMALGVTSNLRGLYYSHPVRGAGDGVIGVAVVKAPIGRIEEEFRRASGGGVLLVDPHGIVFASNRSDWLYRSLRKLSRDEEASVVRSQQFGPGPWEWIGLEIRDDDTAVDEEGRGYLLRRMGVDAYPGWSVVYLRGFRDVSRKVLGPLVDAAGPIILSVCLLVGLAVLFLYRRASDDIVRRRAAEEALEEARAALKRYSEDLERQVRERTREVRSILGNTPAVVYVKDREGRYVYVNSRFKDLFGIRGRGVRGKTDFDLFPRELAVRFRAGDEKVLEEGTSRQVEESVPREDGLRVYLSTKFPIRDEGGATVAVCGISIDITEIKRAQDQMRRLSDSIMASQEKERAAVSRELHDELGQVLTALRLDSAWLKERLGEADADASSRARAMGDLIDKAIDDVRGMAVRLRPGVLDDLGLVDALDWYIGDFEKRANVACIFRPVAVPKVSDRIATAAYRIVQEALTNVARHSGASCAVVSLRAEGGFLTLLVEDDGEGFDIRELAESRGLGVAGMRERAGLIGGTLEIRARPGGGTRIRLKVPLDVAEEALP